MNEIPDVPDFFNEFLIEVDSSGKFDIDNMLTDDERLALEALDKISSMDDFTYKGILKRYEKEEM